MQAQDIVNKWLVATLLLAVTASAPSAQAQVPNVPGVPPISVSTHTTFQQQTHFLTFQESFIPESATTAKAYYKAIDPTGSKVTFQQWLKKAGFIGDENQWKPSGRQIIVNTPGVYGDNIINTDSHVIVVNAADLGFVRNQFIRCVPSCTARNPKIYTYLENYPVAPFAANGSGFPTRTGYPTQAEAAAAIASAINRPLGVLGGDGTSPCNGSPACIERIADVAFEWAPPADGTSPDTRFGQLYAYIFSHNQSGITETLTVPSGLVGKPILDFATGQLTTINAGDPFPPDLDGQGFKQHPGVCFICHGGEPKNLTSSGAYPRNGNVSGFRFLPLDVRSLMFANPGSEFSLEDQEAQIKKYNKAVLLTVKARPQTDDQGVLREPHLAEVIKGWYASYPGDQSMARPTQNGDFIPKGWREPLHGGTARAGSEQLYLQTVATACRSCHFNRELSLDFGTAASFDIFRDAIAELTLRPECDANQPDPRKRPMPAALLTYQRLWEAQAAPRTMADGFVISDTIQKLKSHFGFTSTSYCASNP